MIPLLLSTVMSLTIQVRVQHLHSEYRNKIQVSATLRFQSLLNGLVRTFRVQ